MQAPKLPILPPTKAIWQRSAATDSNGYIAPTIPRRNKTYSTCHRKHIVLCMSSRPHRIDGAQHDSKWTSTRNRKYDAKDEATPRLLGNALRGNRTFPRIRNDTKYPLGRIILIGGQRPQQSMRAFFHGMESRPHKAHQIERGIFHIVRNFKVRRRVRRGSRTRSIIPQLQTSHNFLTHARRNGTPPTTNANTLQ